MGRTALTTHKYKKCEWGIVGEKSICLPPGSPFSQSYLWAHRDIPSHIMQHLLAFACGVLQATTITLVTQEPYYEWKIVDQMPSCWRNWATTVMLFKTSPLRLQRILFISTVPSSSNQNSYSGITCRNCPIYDFTEYNSRKRQLAGKSDRRVWHRTYGTHAPRQAPVSIPIHKSTCAEHPSQATYLDLPY